MNGRARIAAFRNSVVVAIALLVLIPATSRSEFAQDPQQKTATSGLSGVGPVVQGTPDDPLRDTHETHLRHVKQLTFGGQNAEAYFSYDGKRLIFMSTREPYQCDQIYIMNIDGSNVHLLSTGRGRTTCGYFYPDGQHVLYSSTHRAGDDCPPRPDYSHGYVWAVYSSYQIYYATDDGKIEPGRPSALRAALSHPLTLNRNFRYAPGTSWYARLVQQLTIRLAGAGRGDRSDLCRNGDCVRISRLCRSRRAPWPAGAASRARRYRVGLPNSSACSAPMYRAAIAVAVRSSSAGSSDSSASPWTWTNATGFLQVDAQAGPRVAGQRAALRRLDARVEHQAVILDDEPDRATSGRPLGPGRPACRSACRGRGSP